MIRTIAAAAFCAISIIVVLPWLILWTSLTGDPDRMYFVSLKFVRAGLRMAGIRFHSEGVENIPAEACVFACNHASNVDPPIAVLAIPCRVSILAKRGVFHAPIFSVGMRQAGFVPIDRGSKEAAATTVDTVTRHLKEGLSILIFPEGTRSPDGRLRAFKKGAALMAIRASAPVVPVAIVGTPHVMPKGAWRVRPGEVTVRFAPAVNAARYSVHQRPELMARVEAAVAAMLPPDQRPRAGIAQSEVS